VRPRPEAPSPSCGHRITERNTVRPVVDRQPGLTRGELDLLPVAGRPAITAGSVGSWNAKGSRWRWRTRARRSSRCERPRDGQVPRGSRCRDATAPTRHDQDDHRAARRRPSPICRVRWRSRHVGPLPWLAVPTSPRAAHATLGIYAAAATIIRHPARGGAFSGGDPRIAHSDVCVQKRPLLFSSVGVARRHCGGPAHVRAQPGPPSRPAPAAHPHAFLYLGTTYVKVGHVISVEPASSRRSWTEEFSPPCATRSTVLGIALGGSSKPTSAAPSCRPTCFGDTPSRRRQSARSTRDVARRPPASWMRSNGPPRRLVRDDPRGPAAAVRVLRADPAAASRHRARWPMTSPDPAPGD